MNTATQTTTPRIGMSVTYHIGSDAYHQIIVDITRNGRNVVTLPAKDVLGGVSLGVWNDLHGSIRATRARNAWIQLLGRIEDNADDEIHAMFELKHLRERSTFTLRKNGVYVSKGWNCGYLRLNSQFQYQDPSF